MKRLTPQQIAAFRKKIHTHYAHHARTFPWRSTTDPYKVLVSEIMLQQTQTYRVEPKYRAFIQQFPTVRALARAPQKNVLLAWQGLGYNRRALSLQRTAQEIIAKHKGRVPESFDELIALPGIGPYTATAIRAFAFNKPGIVIETNIRAVFIHEFFPRKKKVADSELIPLIEATMDKRNAHRWYSALMDYGVMLKATAGNATKRSTTYTRQSPFTGSDRALRGKILRYLLTRPYAAQTLAQELNEEPTRFNIVMSGLFKDGFIAVKNGRFTIR